MKDWFRSYRDKIPDEFHEDFLDEIAQAMFRRGMDLVLPITLIDTGLIVLEFLRSASDPTAGGAALFGLYFFMLVISVVFLGFRSRMMRIRSSRVRLGISAVFTGILIAWCAAYSLLELQAGGDAVVYMVALVSCGVLALYPPLPSQALVLAVHAAMLLLAPVLAPDHDNLLRVQMNASIALVLSWLMMRIRFNQQAQLHVSRRVIEDKTRALHEKNQQLERLNVELSVLSTIDCLTGAYNRYKLQETLESEWNRCRRQFAPLSAIMLDIDFFKQYNDHYGHVKGDECIRRVSDILMRCASRASDLVVRYGGDEFLILLPQLDQAAAITVAEHIRCKVNEACILTSVSRVADHVTLSLGVATLIPSDSITPEMFLHEADNALYKSKVGSRNCVTSIQLGEAHMRMPGRIGDGAEPGDAIA